MNTKKLFSNLARTGMRLMIFTVMLTALIGNVAGVTAAPARNMLSVTVGAQSGTLAYGTAGDANFSVSVLRGSPNATTPTNFTLSVAGLPAGATVTSGLGPFTFAINPRVVTLTIHSNGSVAVGPDSFNVQASGTGPDPIGSGTLTISQGSQTITFGSLPNKTTSDPDFNVSATGGASGNPVTFTASGACTVGTLVHLTGVGSCTITAHQAGNANYGAAPDVAQSFAITAAGPSISFDLYAVTGSTTLPGSVTVPVWGYNTINAAVTKPGGPVLIVNQNDNVVITLHNQLTENTALLFQGMNMIPDTTGASAGGTKTYAFTASKPGTFLYEAGLIPGKQHQVAMGLYGALIVRPTGAPLQAYAGSDTAFNTEQVLVLSELDTALNAAPATFDMRKYSPKYYLINGEAHPDTDLISVTAGNKVLLRYVDAGLQAHAMSTLGLSQTLVGQDGSPMTPHAVVSETVAPGQTLDTIVTILASAALGTQYPLYDASLFLRNNKGTTATSTGGLGGMLTFLTVGVVTPPTDVGPSASALGLSPNPTNGSVAVTVTATITDGVPGATNIAQAEFYIDTTVGSPNVMTADTGFNSTSEAVTGTISTGMLTALASSNHTIYVRGRDTAGLWGSFASIVLNLDKIGPASTGLVLSPSLSDGTVSVNLTFTANDSASGNSNVTASEYWVDAGLPVAITVASPAPSVNLNATIPSGLSAGTHVVSVRSQDALLNWGATSTISLKIDNVGPATSNVVAVHNPNNGSTPFNTSVLAVRVSADFSDVATGNSNLTNAEGFLDTYNASLDGTGFVFIANDGNFDSPAESGYGDIPLAVVNTLSNGAHLICVHAKDAAGKWGPINCATSLTIDRTPPTVTSINRANANPAPNGSVNFSVTFSESVTGVTAGNFTIVRTGLGGTSTITSVTGGGSAWTVTATTGTGTGTLGLNLTSPTGISDLAGNALATTSFVGQVYNIVPPPQPSLYFSTAGNTNPLGVGGTADDADIYFYNTSTSAFTRSIDASTAPYSLPATGGGNANVDGFDRVDATHFYMSFTGNVAVPGLGTVQDEDVVFYNAGTWSVYFDGTPGTRGLSGSDLDAISIVGTTLYFSTDDTDVPTGVIGGGDDADIYSWNGTTFARVVNASDVGWSTTNVDGLVWVDATHVYLSYSSDTTVPGSLAVQDEDVVRNNGGTWSVYYDGTAVGLGTDGNLDIDAFDLP